MCQEGRVVFSLGKTVRLAGAKSSHHSIATVSFWAYLAKKKKKKKHISKMTWQLTVKYNWGCDLLTEPNVRVSNQSSEMLGCKIQSPPNVRGVLCNLANLFYFGKLYIIMYHGESNFTSCALSNVLLSCRTFSWCLRFTISYFCWLNFKAILVACWHWYFSYFVQPWILMEI